MLERLAEIVTNSTPVIIGAVLRASLAVAVLIDIYRKFNPPKDGRSIRARYDGERAVVSALGAFMSGAFYFAVYIGTGLVIVVLIAWLIDYFT